MADWVRNQGDMALNPDVYGAKESNIDLLRPVFYVAPELGANIARVVRDIIGNDSRFFLPYDEDEHENYNYNDNTPLVDAIQNGARGAYWDILRKLR
jgi:tryptophan 2-C-methyltransferase